MTERFPRSRRLRHADEFKRVFSDSCRVDGAGYIIRASANQQPHARLGLAISKRQCPRAVDRNRLKRIARESFRVQLGALPPVDVVVLCRPNAKHLTKRELFSGLDRVWKKLIGATWPES